MVSTEAPYLQEVFAQRQSRRAKHPSLDIQRPCNESWKLPSAPTTHTVRHLAAAGEPHEAPPQVSPAVRPQWKGVRSAFPLHPTPHHVSRGFLCDTVVHKGRRGRQATTTSKLKNEQEAKKTCPPRALLGQGMSPRRGARAEQSWGLRDRDEEREQESLIPLVSKEWV